MAKFKPMMAGKVPENLDDLIYPLFVSPRLDGVRCLIQDGAAYTQNLTRVPNVFIQEQLGGLPNGLDGELTMGQDVKVTTVRKAVMSREGEPNFLYCVFDWCQAVVDMGIGASSVDKNNYQVNNSRPYVYRYNTLQANQHKFGDRVEVVPHWNINSRDELRKAEQAYQAEGYHSGLTIRSPLGQYKQGRSTTKQGWLLQTVK